MSASANEPGRPRAPFEGTLVRLRAREPEDESLLFAWFNDPEGNRIELHQRPTG